MSSCGIDVDGSASASACMHMHYVLMRSEPLHMQWVLMYSEPRRMEWVLICSKPLHMQLVLMCSEPLEAQRSGGRREQQAAITSYTTLAQDRNLAWLQLTPQTGTHLFWRFWRAPDRRLCFCYSTNSTSTNQIFVARQGV